jgi:hypothetical protein
LWIEKLDPELMVIQEFTGLFSFIFKPTVGRSCQKTTCSMPIKFADSVKGVAMAGFLTRASFSLLLFRLITEPSQGRQFVTDS